MAFYCTSADVIARLSSTGYNLRVDDDPNSFTQAAQRATSKINFSVQNLYEQSDLQNDANNAGWTNDTATTLATYYLCGRRGNPRPESVKSDYEEALEELEEVHNDLYQIPNVPARHTSCPAWSNVRIDGSYQFKKIRVEPQLSEGSAPKGYVQSIDWRSAFYFEF